MKFAAVGECSTPDGCFFDGGILPDDRLWLLPADFHDPATLK
jgi:hypothetical protein